MCVALQMGGNPFGAPIDAMAAFGFGGPNMNPQVKGFLLPKTCFQEVGDVRVFCPS